MPAIWDALGLLGHRIPHRRKSTERWRLHMNGYDGSIVVDLEAGKGFSGVLADAGALSWSNDLRPRTGAEIELHRRPRVWWRAVLGRDLRSGDYVVLRLKDGRAPQEREFVLTDFMRLADPEAPREES